MVRHRFDVPGYKPQGGDQGADPNQLVKITDSPAATAAAASERFTTVFPARYGQVVRGVSVTPGTR